MSNHWIIPFSAAEVRTVHVGDRVVLEVRDITEEIEKRVEEERMRLREFYERLKSNTPR
ncbi:hypothetical protein [Alicyclobacillus acidocaldarius]|uniref:Uncharacterized protein n=1 Tax=Alicyclobacillus acidocaldarius subsp. acidocaldarius (strain ATCC 27009 / DSM 446 / BCRC 14685 / JCM 5260 / KCTC 1825 / NBRC 15652 / NCIMB 11725 / NRRL B-14509 / 104-IA) TaxID=521098 RepID=C8WVV8_ALIAD|nr:hypothetical protein [Alicyclobacillus acidocaldarius]ACV58230.1 hypothetical protein Aaci_1199 [Alicyclobacillus acidocaldarius subsp. acidocaldarius DSM 446]